MEPLDPQRFRPAATLTGPQVAERAGVPYDYASRVFRALGFPELPDDAVEFDERDVQMLTALHAILSQGYTPDDVLTVARTYGYALSRIADAEVRLFRKTYVDPLRAQGIDGDALGARLQEVVPQLLDVLGQQLDHVHRRHLAVALQRVTASQMKGSSQLLAAGFVDLVGFASVTEGLDSDELGRLVSRFETLAVERCADHGAHLVKMIGDAVMLVAPQASAAVTTAVAIVRGADEDAELPHARAGLDFGQAVSLGGDFFGRPVNVAARLASFARRGTVVASAELIEALPEDVDASRIGRTRLKGIGAVRAFKVNAYPAERSTDR